MTIETYIAEYKTLEALYKAGILGVGSYITKMYDLKRRYVAGKGSFLTPVVL